MSLQSFNHNIVEEPVVGAIIVRLEWQVLVMTDKEDVE